MMMKKGIFFEDLEQGFDIFVSTIRQFY